MKKERMAICDNDEKYVYRLQELLEQRSSFPFEVSVFTGEGKIPEDVTGEKYRLILAGEKFYEMMKEKGIREEQLLLLKSSEKVSQAKEYIWKYQSGDKIRRQIAEYIAKQDIGEEVFVPGRKKGTLIGIFSPVCRELQSSFALLLGQYLAKQESVLYLNFESFSGLGKMLGDTRGRDLTDLVYYMEGGRERLSCKLESMVGNLNGLDYISPAFSFVDLSEVKEESWMLLLHTIKEIGNYDHILLDLSENVHGVLNILRECEKIFTLSHGKGMAKVQLAQYEDLLQKLDYEDILQHTRKCELPVFDRLPESVEELPHSEMAAYVKGILKEAQW